MSAASTMSHACSGSSSSAVLELGQVVGDGAHGEAVDVASFEEPPRGAAGDHLPQLGGCGPRGRQALGGAAGGARTREAHQRGVALGRSVAQRR
jgi:hypothetical protein